MCHSGKHFQYACSYLILIINTSLRPGQVGPLALRGQQAVGVGGTPASSLELCLRILAGQKVDQMLGRALGLLPVGLS